MPKQPLFLSYAFNLYSAAWSNLSTHSEHSGEDHHTDFGHTNNLHPADRHLHRPLLSYNIQPLIRHSCVLFKFSYTSSLYSSVVERQSCKLKVLGSIPSGGCLIQTWDFISHDDHASDLWRYWLHILFSFYETTPTVGLEPTTTRLRAWRSTDWARRAWSICWETITTVEYSVVLKSELWRIHMTGRSYWYKGRELSQYLLQLLFLNLFHEEYTRDGTRTHNLLLRREAPYPLGHTSRCALAPIWAVAHPYDWS